MKNSKKAWIIFSRTLTVLFIIFLINYFQVESGNYNNLNDKTVLTEEKIREFEEDVKNGNYVDIKDYTTMDYTDTSNNISNMGYYIGESIDDFINNKVLTVLTFIGNLFK